MSPTVGVVTLAAGRRRHLARQFDSIRQQVRRADRYVVIDMGGPMIEVLAPRCPEVVSAPQPAGVLQLAHSRNLGFEAVGADIVVFLDADCIAAPELVGALADRVEHHPGIHAGPVGYLPPRTDLTGWETDRLAGLSTYQRGRPKPTTALHRTMRFDLFWSLAFAIDRVSWERIGGFDERFVGYGGEDTDFARSARERDVDIWFGSAGQAFHQFHPTSSPPTQHLDAICRNATLYFDKWGEWPMSGWLTEFARLGLISWRHDAHRIEMRSPSP